MEGEQNTHKHFSKFEKITFFFNRKLKLNENYIFSVQIFWVIFEFLI